MYNNWKKSLSRLIFRKSTGADFERHHTFHYLLSLYSVSIRTFKRKVALEKDIKLSPLNKKAYKSTLPKIGDVSSEYLLTKEVFEEDNVALG